MKKLLSILVIIIILAAIVFSIKHTTNTKKSKPTATKINHSKETTLALNLANNKLGIKIFKLLSKPGKNLNLSPVSTSYILGTLLNGSKGTTKEQILQALPVSSNLANINKEFLNLSHSLSSDTKISNSLWLQQDFNINTNFKNDLIKYFNTQIIPTNFIQPSKTQALINKFVKQKTAGLIPQLLNKPLSRDTSIAIVNTVLFNGKWLFAFNPRQTKLADFHSNTTRKQQIEMMHQTHALPYLHTKAAQITELPYKHNVVMVVMLPNKGASLNNVISQLNIKEISNLQRQLHITRLQLSLPRFNAKSTIQLKNVLESMGVTNIFNAKFANLTAISKKHPLYVLTVLQKVLIKINEKGTKAAAASIAGLNRMAIVMQPPKAIVFNANHAFLYLILNTKTNTILFMGSFWG